MYGFPYVSSFCWANGRLKTELLKKIQKNVDTVYIGFSAGEEKRKKSDPKFKYPLIEWGWTSEDCQEYLFKKNLVNPLYQLGFTRLGCWLCPKQSLQSLKTLYYHYPRLWEKLKQLEKESPQGFKPNFSLDQFEKKITSQANKKL